MNQQFKSMLQNFIDSEITSEALCKWARDTYYDILDCEELLFSIECMSIIPFLTQIAFLEPDVCFSIENAKQIKEILNRRIYFNKFFSIQLNPRSDKRIEAVESIWKNYNKNNYPDSKTIAYLESEIQKSIEPKNLYDIVYNNLLETLSGMIIKNNSGNECDNVLFNEINVEEGYNVDELHRVVNKLLSIYHGEQVFRVNLMYVEYGLLVNLII